MAYHAATFTGLTAGIDPGQEGLGSWVHHLNVGVSVFFVLSGFLLFRPFVAAHLDDRPGPAVGPYLWRRAVRIYPAYWVALLVSAWWLDTVHLGGRWDQLSFLTLTQVYRGPTALGGLVQAWTLATEVSFYVFLPLWAAALARVGGPIARRARAHYAGLAALVVVGLAFRGALRAGGHVIGYAWLPANIDLFAIGMAIAVAVSAAERGRPVPAALQRLGELPALAWLAAGCCYWAVVQLGIPYGLAAPSTGQEVAREALFGAVALLVVAPCVVGDLDRGTIRAVLAWRPLHAIGVVSYGLYLWHLSVMTELFARWPGPLEGGVRPVWSWVRLAVLSAAGALVIATISWRLLERPLIRRVRGRA